MTGELLRMTAPRAFGAVSPEVPRDVAPEIVLAARRNRCARRRSRLRFRWRTSLTWITAPSRYYVNPRGQPSHRPRRESLKSSGSRIPDWRGRGGAQGDHSRYGSGASIALTALTLARLIAQHVRVVVVDLAASLPAIPAVRSIRRPRAFRTDGGRGVVFAGHHQGPEVARPSRQRRAPRLRPRATPVAAVDAGDRRAAAGLRPCAARAGTASDLPAELLTSQARAVVVPEASMAPDAREQMCDQLRAVGFSEVTMLSQPFQRRMRSSRVRASWRRERADICLRRDSRHVQIRTH